MATFKSNSYEGRYLQLVVTETSVNHAKNTSTLTWTLTSTGGEVEYYAVAATTITIAGQTVYTSSYKDWTYAAFPVAKGSKSGTVDVTHDTNGKKDITVVFKTGVYYNIVDDYGGSMTLSNLDRTAPTVTHSVSNLTASGFKISVSANEDCDIFQYSLDGGSTYTTFSETVGKSASVTLTGLDSKTYSVRTRARKDKNEIYGYSEKASVDIVPPTVTHSVSGLSTSGFTISISASTTCDTFQYSINGGSTYTTCSTTEGTSATVTLTDLKSDTYSVRTRAKKKLNQIYGYSEKATTDIIPPTVTHSVSNITANSFVISITASTTSNKFDYSIDGGKTYINCSTTSGTTASVTVSNLAANTSYPVRTRARRSYNNLFGYSAEASAKTLGQSVITEVTAISADETTPTVAFKCTVYEASFYHKVFLKTGTETIQIGTFKESSAGTVSKSFNVSSTDREKILADMKNVKSKDMTLLLKTYSDSAYATQVGSDSTFAVSVATSSAESAPIFTSFTYKDNSAVANVTGNDQILVQSVSDLLVTCTAGTALNGAKIETYTATIGEVTVSSTSGSIPVGAVATTGTLTLEVTCTDSRGYSTSQSVKVTVVEYKAPEIRKVTVERRYGTEAIVNMTFNGTFSPVKIGGIAKNEIVDIRYMYKNAEDAWTDEQTSVLNKSGVTESSFSADITDLDIECDTDDSFHFYLCIYDKIHNAVSGGQYAEISEMLTLPPAKPAFSLRKKNATYKYRRVGVFNNDPKLPLDVGADDESNAFGINGKPMADFIVEQGTKNIWTYRKWNSGIAECWGIQSYAEMSSSTAYGALFKSNNYVSGVSYPFSFTGAPCLTTSVQRLDDDIDVLLLTSSPGTASKTPTCYLLTVTSQSNCNGAIHFYAVGRWK